LQLQNSQILLRLSGDIFCTTGTADVDCFAIGVDFAGAARSVDWFVHQRAIVKTANNTPKLAERSTAGGLVIS
jgi:hypothetical protein